MKADENVYHIMQVPNIIHNSFNLLHSDDYLKDNVEVSTFTPQDDILLKLKNSFLAFDIHGNQIQVKINDEILRLGIF